MRVLVTGGTGALGPAVVAALAEHGHTVSVMTRGRLPAEVQARATAIRGDITSAADVRRAATGADAIVHLAALLHVPLEAPVADDAYERVNVTGTQHVIAAAQEVGARRVVLASTVAVYGDTPSSPVQESAPLAPVSAYARTKAKAESLVRGAADLSPVILRFPAVYGGHMKGHYRQLVTFLRTAPMVVPGSGHNRRSLIFEQDAALAIATALTHPAAAGRTFNVADETPYEVRRTIAAIAAALGHRPPRLFVPRAIAIGVAGALELIAPAAGRRAQAAAARLRKFNEDFVVDATAIAAALGLRAATPIDEGWRQTIAALDRHGPAD
jgi:UDP-glucose 4-epimerase